MEQVTAQYNNNIISASVVGDCCWRHFVVGTDHTSECFHSTQPDVPHCYRPKVIQVLTAKRNFHVVLHRIFGHKFATRDSLIENRTMLSIRIKGFANAHFLQGIKSPIRRYLAKHSICVDFKIIWLPNCLSWVCTFKT